MQKEGEESFTREPFIYTEIKLQYYMYKRAGMKLHAGMRTYLYTYQQLGILVFRCSFMISHIKTWMRY